MRDEFVDVLIKEFFGVRSKTHSYLKDDDKHKKNCNQTQNQVWWLQKMFQSWEIGNLIGFIHKSCKEKSMEYLKVTHTIDQLKVNGIASSATDNKRIQSFNYVKTSAHITKT